MKNLIIIAMVVFSTNLFSQTLASYSGNTNLPKGQVMTSSRNGKEETNVWSLKDERWLTFNDKIYPFTKDVKTSGLTKICGWIVIADKQYRVVLFIEVTTIEITNAKGERVNSFN